jgi:hypothetical protein
MPKRRQSHASVPGYWLWLKTGSRALKRKLACCAAVLAFAAAGAGAASAQPVPPPYSGSVQPDGGMAVPPQEVAAIVRSAGLEPLGRPLRQGPVYVLRARDPSDGEELRVIVNAQMGRIVRVVPVMMPRYGVPVVRPPGRIAVGPDGAMGMPAGAEGPFGPGLAATSPYDPAAPAGPPPLPRPRPKLAATEGPAAKPAGAVSPQPASGAMAKDGNAGETTGSIARPANSSPAIEMAE